MAETELSEASTNQHFIKANSDAMAKAIATATTPEAANYLFIIFKSTIEKSPGTRQQYAAVLDQIEKYVEVVTLQNTDNTFAIWHGDKNEAILTKYRAYQTSKGEKAIEDIINLLPEGEVINFDFAINDKASLLQGFSIGGQPPTTELSENMNLIFSNWLTCNDMICQDGVIYQTDKSGTILENAQGKLTVNHEDYVERFILDKQNCFEHFCLTRSHKKLHINVTLREYPKPTPENPEP